MNCKDMFLHFLLTQRLDQRKGNLPVKADRSSSKRGGDNKHKPKELHGSSLLGWPPLLVLYLSFYLNEQLISFGVSRDELSSLLIFLQLRGGQACEYLGFLLLS